MYNTTKLILHNSYQQKSVQLVLQWTKKLPTTSEYFVFFSFLNWIEVDPKGKQLKGKLLLFDQCKYIAWSLQCHEKSQVEKEQEHH